ncbi:MAG TPA: hypothetical protein VGB59_04200 [Allosphingosinicella sp.]
MRPREEPRAVPPSPNRGAASILGPAPSEPENIDAFAHEPPFRPRRNPARMWTMLAIGAALLMLAATAAISFLGVPQLGGGLSLPGRGATPLKLEFEAQNRTLASGNTVLTVTGRILNPTEQVQRVPPIRGELRDEQGRAVYSWPISPPVAELQPGQTANVNAAEVDTPRSARKVHLSFGPSV